MREQRRDPPHVLALVDDVVAPHPPFPAVGPDGRGQDAKERRLAGAVAPRDHHHPPGGELKGDVGQRPPPSVAAGKPVDVDRWVPHGCGS